MVTPTSDIQVFPGAENSRVNDCVWIWDEMGVQGRKQTPCPGNARRYGPAHGGDRTLMSRWTAGESHLKFQLNFSAFNHS